MSEFWKKFLGAVLLIATMGFSSCMAMLNVRAADIETPSAPAASEY